MNMNHGLKITKDGTLIVTLPRGVNIRQVIVQEEQTFEGDLFIKETDINGDGDEINKIIDGIDKEINGVPSSEEGFYSQGSMMFIAGLTRAKEVVERINKR